MSWETLVKKYGAEEKPERSFDEIVAKYAPDLAPQRPAAVTRDETTPRETAFTDYVGEVGRSIPRGLATTTITTAGGAAETALDIGHAPGLKATSSALKLLNYFSPAKYSRMYEAVAGQSPAETADSIDEFIDARYPLDKELAKLLDQAVKTGHEAVLRNIPVTPGFENSWTRKITEGAMSVGPALAAGVLGGPAGLSAFGAAVGYGSTFRNAMELTGGDVDASRDYARMSAVVGAGTEPAFGAAGQTIKIFKRLDKASEGWLKKLVRSSFKTGGGEAIEEGTQEIPDEVARRAYQKERTLIDSLAAIGESAAIGGIVGTIFGGFASGIKSRLDVGRSRMEAAEAGLEAPPAPPEPLAPGEVEIPPEPISRITDPLVVEKLAALAEKETPPSRKEYADATGMSEKEAGMVPVDQRSADAQAAKEQQDAQRAISDVRKAEENVRQDQGRKDYQRGQPAGPTGQETQKVIPAETQVENALTRNALKRIEAMKPRQVEDRLRVLYEQNKDIIEADTASMEGAAFLSSEETEQVAQDKFIRPGGYSFRSTKAGRSAANEVKALLPANLRWKVAILGRKNKNFQFADGEDVMRAIGPDRMAEAIIQGSKSGRQKGVTTPAKMANFVLDNPQIFGTESEAVMLANKLLGNTISIKPKTTIDAMSLQEGDTVAIAGQKFTVNPVNPEADSISLSDESGRERTIPLVDENGPVEIEIDEGSYQTAIKGSGRGVTTNLLGQPETEKGGQTKLLTEEEIDFTRTEALPGELPQPKPQPKSKPVPEVEGQLTLLQKNAAEAKAEADSLLAQLKERTGGKPSLMDFLKGEGGSIDPENVRLLVRFVGARIRAGAYTAADFLAEMARQFTDAFVSNNRAQLQEIYETAVGEEGQEPAPETPPSPPAPPVSRTSDPSKGPPSNRNRANPFVRPMSRELWDRLQDERNQRGEWETQTDAQAGAAMEARLAADYAGEREKVMRGDLLERFKGAGVDTLVAREILDRELQAAFTSNNESQLTEGTIASRLYENSGTELGRAMRNRRDKVMSPRERQAATTARLLNEPPPRIARAIEQALAADLEEFAQARQRARTTSYARPSEGGAAEPATEAAPPPRRKSRGVRKAEARYREALDEFDSYLKRRGESLGTAGGNIDPQAVRLLTRVAVRFIGLKGREFADWLADLTDRYGVDQVRRMAREIGQAWNAAITRADQQNIVPVDPGPFRTTIQPPLDLPEFQALQAPPGEPFQTRIQPDLGIEQPLSAPPIAGPTTGPQGRLVQEPAPVSPEGAVPRKTTGPQINIKGMNRTRKIAEKWAKMALARKDYLVLRGFDVDGALAGTVDPLHVIKMLNEVQALNNSWANAVYEYFRTNLVFGPITFVRNATSFLNVLNEITTKKFATVLMDSTFRQLPIVKKWRATGDGGARWGEIITGLQAFLKSWGDAKTVFMLSFDTEKPIFDAWAARAGRGYDLEAMLDAAMAHIEAHPPAITGLKGRIQRIPFRGQGATDQMMKTGIGKSVVTTEAYRIATNEGLKGRAKLRRMVELLRDPASPAWVKAVYESNRATFTEKGGKFAQKMNELFKMEGLRWIFPFFNTAGNLLKTFARYYPGTSPLNIGHKIWKDVQQGKWEHTTPAVAEAALGWASLLFIAATNGEKEEDRWINGRRSRTKPFTIRLGDTYLNYEWVQPFSSWIATTVDLVDAIRTGDPMTVLYEPLISMFNQIEHYPVFVGLSDFAKAFYYSAKQGGPNLEYIAQWSGRFVASFVPGGNLTRHVVEATKDTVPNRRINGHEALFLKNLARTTLQRTGVGSLIIPDIPKRTIWGEPIPKDGSFLPFPGTDILFRLLVPVTEQRMPETTGDRIINNWNLFHERERWLPEEPNMYFEIKGKQVYLTPQQYDQYSELAGKKSVELLRERLKAEERWRTVKPENPTERDLQMVKDALEDGRRIARQELKAKWGMFNQ